MIIGIWSYSNYSNYMINLKDTLEFLKEIYIIFLNSVLLFIIYIGSTFLFCPLKHWGWHLYALTLIL